MEATARIETNILDRQIRATRPMAKKWIKEAISSPPPKGASAKTKRRIVLPKTLKKLRKKKGK